MSNVTTYLHARCTDVFMTSALTIFKMKIYNIISDGILCIYYTSIPTTKKSI